MLITKWASRGKFAELKKSEILRENVRLGASKTPYGQANLKIKLIAALATLLLSVTAGCNRVARVPTQTPSPSSAATAPSIRSPSGKIYTRTPAGAADNDEPTEIPSLARGVPSSTDDYRGTARKAAKLSVATGASHTFPDLTTLLQSLVPDDQMRAMHISSQANSDRVPQEEMVVTVRAYLYASSHESDNDFHCILGSDPSGSTSLMNVEVSGLPPAGSPSLATLKTARNEFKAFFTLNQNALPGEGYDKYNPPIPVQILGSLFFDVDHQPGSVGPVGLRPQTAWEIHPVSDIQFEPSPPSP